MWGVQSHSVTEAWKGQENVVKNQSQRPADGDAYAPTSGLSCRKPTYCSCVPQILLGVHSVLTAGDKTGRSLLFGNYILTEETGPK